MSFETWLAFAAASTALLMIPGPTVLLVLSYALSRGRKVAVSTALGVAFGDLIAMVACLLGLGALIAASATAFTVLKWAGAAYLVWLGLRLIRAPAESSLPLPSEARGTFGHAALVTALNPKSVPFFVAFVPQFIDPSRPVLPQAVILVATFVGLAGTNALLYALAADRLRARISRPGVIAALQKVGGATLIAMGALTATLRRSA